MWWGGAKAAIQQRYYPFAEHVMPKDAIVFEDSDTILTSEGAPERRRPFRVAVDRPEFYMRVIRRFQTLSFALHPPFHRTSHLGAGSRNPCDVR